jgi:tRNA G18 (ribose-2'-O)-methylase SpoU
MPTARIDGPDDPRVAAFREVADAERLRSLGVFVAEGRLIVRRVLDDARYRIRSILLNEPSRHDLERILEARAPDVSVFVADNRHFLDITGHNLHRGCLALVERPQPTPVDRVLAASERVVVLEDITNADNVGGIFRNAAAFHAGVLLTAACCDPLYRKAIRTSMGAVLRVPYARADDLPATLEKMRRCGFVVAALTPRAPSDDLERFCELPRPRVALLVGTEGVGLSPVAESSADYRVCIPMDDDVDSLNVAVAVGIALYALARH